MSATGSSGERLVLASFGTGQMLRGARTPPGGRAYWNGYDSCLHGPGDAFQFHIIEWEGLAPRESERGSGPAALQWQDAGGLYRLGTALRDLSSSPPSEFDGRARGLRVPVGSGDPWKVSASTQNQALAALLFLYSEVLHRPLESVGGVVHANGRFGCPWS